MDVLLIILLTASTLVFIGAATEITAYSSFSSVGDREPIPPAPKPPAVPVCPSQFEDVGCSVAGSAGGKDRERAFKAAQLECDRQLEGCIDSQTLEFNQNKMKCIAVAGCQLSIHIPADYQPCDGTADNRCTIINEITEDASVIRYQCNVFGRYNLYDYTCARNTYG